MLTVAAKMLQVQRHGTCQKGGAKDDELALGPLPTPFPLLPSFSLNSIVGLFFRDGII